MQTFLILRCWQYWWRRKDSTLQQCNRCARVCEPNSFERWNGQKCYCCWTNESWWSTRYGKLYAISNYAWWWWWWYCRRIGHWWIENCHCWNNKRRRSSNQIKKAGWFKIMDQNVNLIYYWQGSFTICMMIIKLQIIINKFHKNRYI